MTLAELPKLEKRISQEQVDRYAHASGDFNPIHVDPAYAATTQYGRTIAHGMLTLAFLSEMMTAAFSEAWIKGGKLKARFRAPVFPGDTVTTLGILKSQQAIEGATRLEYTVGCQNQRGETVVSGDAGLTLPFEATHERPRRRD